ncbi:MAG: hypothetical protein ACOH10_08030 [Rhodoglobus sp.]
MTSNYAWAYPSLAAAADLTASVSPVMNAIDTTVKTVETAANAVKAVAHARFPATAGSAIGTAWSTVAINSTIDSSASPPYSLAAGVVTISQPGVYLLSATVSAGISTFALRISVGAAIVAQTAVASGVSLTQSLDRCVRVTAGSAVKVEIYATSASTHSLDSSTTPVSLTITQIGL